MLRTDTGLRFENVVRAIDTDLHVPHICDVELVSTLRRSVLKREMSAARARLALDRYVRLPLTRHNQLPLLGRTFELRDNFSAYDATYVALAERLNAALMTADERLARAVPAHTQVVIVP